jgi:hypothetical protein
MSVLTCYAIKGTYTYKNISRTDSTHEILGKTDKGNPPANIPSFE